MAATICMGSILAVFKGHLVRVWLFLSYSAGRSSSMLGIVSLTRIEGYV